MKRKLISILALSLTVGLVACASKSDHTTNDIANTTPSVTEDTPAVEATIVEEPSIEEPSQEGSTPAQILLSDFKAQMKDSTSNSTMEMAESILANKIIPFAGATMDVVPGYLNGFSEEISGFTSGTMFGPMIGSIPFVGYIFDLEESSDVTAFMEQLRSKADLNWNICTCADEMVCDAVGNRVFFVMSTNNFDE